jgi:hypothetical protein
MHRICAFLTLTLLACGNGQRPSADRESPSTAADTGPEPGPPARSPELAVRADSLARLDPKREARAAIARGDLRFIAVCGYGTTA